MTTITQQQYEAYQKHHALLFKLDHYDQAEAHMIGGVATEHDDITVDGRTEQLPKGDWAKFHELSQLTLAGLVQKDHPHIQNVERAKSDPFTRDILGELLREESFMWVPAETANKVQTYWDKNITDIAEIGQQKASRASHTKTGTSWKTITSLGAAGLLAIATLTTAAIKGINSLTSGSKKDKQEERAPAQTAKTPAPTHTAEATNGKKTFTMAAKLQAATNDISAAAAGTTNNVSTNAVALTVPQEPEKKAPAWLIGNRPVAGNWIATEQARNMTTRDRTVFSRLMVGEFNSLYRDMDEKNLRCQQIISEGYYERHLSPMHNRIRPDVEPGEESRSWYVDDMPELIKDVKNYYRNIRDVLAPLDYGEQLAAMQAFGPAMGFSVTSQENWQSKHRAESEQAYQTISKSAREILTTTGKSTNDVSEVMGAVLQATATYREQHPENQALLLTADKSIRTIANIKLKDMQRQQNIAAENAQAKQDERAAIARENPVEYARMRQAEQREMPRETGYPWWKIGLYVAGGAVAASWVFNRKKSDKAY